MFLLSFDTFRPPTCHTNLRKLIIRLENLVSLSDDELADLDHSWPLLQVVEFCYARQLPKEAKRMTSKGLLSLVLVCPELRHVCLTLDGRVVPSGAAVGLGSKTIMSLRFPNSPVHKRMRLVAKFLLTYFPSVTSVSEIRVQTGPPDAFQVDRHDREWAEVEEYMVDPSKLESRAES